MSHIYHNSAIGIDRNTTLCHSVSVSLCSNFDNLLGLVFNETSMIPVTFSQFTHGLVTLLAAQVR